MNNKKPLKKNRTHKKFCVYEYRVETFMGAEFVDGARKLFHGSANSVCSGHPCIATWELKFERLSVESVCLTQTVRLNTTSKEGKEIAKQWDDMEDMRLLCEED